MDQVTVLDAEGRCLTPCAAEKADRLVAVGRAVWVSHEPGVIRLSYIVELPEARPAKSPAVVAGGRLLLHICCAPCSIYSVARLRQVGWDLTGYWFNPNIHPYAEHSRRRKSLERYAGEIVLPVIWEPGYEMPAFLRAVSGQERYRQRCMICYRLRLERTARVAREHGFDAISTTLLISPYQDQAAIRRIGEELAHEHGLAFYFENLRRGFGPHYRVAREHGLYLQRYCGCLYSEWEALDHAATTRAQGESADDASRAGA